MAKTETNECFPGDIIPQFYADVSMDRIPDCYIPLSDIAYITILLNEKFGVKLSYQAVEKLLEEELPRPL